MKKRVLYLSLLGLMIIIISFIFILIYTEDRSIDKKSIENIKKSIVFITYDFTGTDENNATIDKQGFGTGIIYYNKNNIMQILTNRHVIDCGYLTDSPCKTRSLESYKIKAYDNNYLSLSKIIYPTNNIDLAILEIDSLSLDYPELDIIYNDLTIGSSVIGIGYPSLFPKVIEYKVSYGKIIGKKDLITTDGLSYTSIDSNIYTNHGSSGGGLFDEKGYLIGINTWIDGGKSISINTNILNDIKNFTSCPKNNYYSSNICFNYTINMNN